MRHTNKITRHARGDAVFLEKIMTLKYGIALAAVAAFTVVPMSASAHDNGYNHRHQNSNGDDQLVGGVIGAIAGGVIGSQIAGNGARTEGSVLGAVIGGVAGAAIAGDNNGSRTYGNVQYSNGYSNRYSGGGYYAQPTYGQSYPVPTYQTYSHTYYGQPTYSYGSQPYYGPSTVYYNTQPAYPRTRYGAQPSVTISIGSNGYYRNPQPHYYNGRGHDRRGNYRRRGH